MEPQKPGVVLSVPGKGELMVRINVCDQMTAPGTTPMQPGEGALMSGMHGLERDSRGRSQMSCCKSDREQVVICDKCKNGYHLTCLRPILAKVPHGSWLCRECSPATTAVLSLSQEDILAFFGIQRFSEELSKGPATPTSPKAKKGPRSKTRRWLRYVPSKDQGRRLNQLKSLAVALIASGSRFTDEFIFSPEMAIKSANNVNLESSQTQVLNKADRETLSQCKNMLKSGECPPLLVVSDPVQGYIVQADETIKDLTFICEYTGEVDYLKNRDCDNSCSLMMLLEATNPAEDLVICPDKFGNISRFLSGINNFRRESRKKLNCKLVRYNVDGEMRVFIVAIRKIEKGTTLYCVTTMPEAILTPHITLCDELTIAWIDSLLILAKKIY